MARVRAGTGVVSLALMAALALPGAALAVQPDEILPDAALESRARGLSSELRCLVCQNQSIDDSDAPLARDLRVLVRERLQAGDSDDAVKSYVVARYGDFVLLKPPVKMSTMLLWLAPLLVLATACGYAVCAMRAMRSGAASQKPTGGPALSAAEERRLKDVLAASAKQNTQY